MATRESIEFDFRRAMQEASEIDEIADRLVKLSKEKFEYTMQNLAVGWKGENASFYLRKGETLQGKMTRIILIIVVCLIAIVAAIVVVIIYIVRRNKNKNSFEAIKDDTLLQMNSTKCDDDGKTELVGSFSKPSDDGATFLMWNTETSYDIILTDIHSPVKSFQAPLRSNVIIGRKKDMCGIALDYDKSVSSRHCEIKVRDGKFYINDLQSSNGTYVNGCKVLTEIEIFSGNIIKMGRLELRFEVK